MVVSVPEALAWPLKVPALLGPRGPWMPSPRGLSSPECPEPAHSSWCLLLPPEEQSHPLCRARPGHSPFLLLHSWWSAVSPGSPLGPFLPPGPSSWAPFWPYHAEDILELFPGSGLLSVESQRPCGQMKAPGGLCRSCGPHLGRPAWQRLLPLSFWHILLPCLALASAPF